MADSTDGRETGFDFKKELRNETTKQESVFISASKNHLNTVQVIESVRAVFSELPSSVEIQRRLSGG